MHDPHAASAAAAGRLDDDRIADARAIYDFFADFGQRSLVSGHTRNTRFFHRLLGRYLVAHRANRFGPRTDKAKAALFDTLGEIGVLGQEAVPGMNRFGVRNFGRTDDGGNIEIAVLDAAGPMQTDSSASFTYLASASASECTATVLMPISRHARCTRKAISPRLAIRIFLNMAGNEVRSEICHGTYVSIVLFNDEQRLAVFHWLAVFDQDLLDRAAYLSFDFV